MASKRPGPDQPNALNKFNSGLSSPSGSMVRITIAKSVISRHGFRIEDLNKGTDVKLQKYCQN